MDLNYNLLKTFVKVAETGSFTGASKLLKQPKSRVSRAIARLEKELNVQLFRRTTRNTSLTKSGSDLYKNISYHFEKINNEISRTSDLQSEMSGKIKITASETFSQTFLPKLIDAFHSQYPDVKFEALITNEYVDLNKEDIDLAFRAGKLEDSSLIQRKIFDVSYIFVCSQEYSNKYGKPERLTDLSDHKVLMFSPLEQEISIEAKLRDLFLSATSLSMLNKMALEGQGIAILPDFLCRDNISEKKLVSVMPNWKLKKGGIYMLYPPSKNVSKRVKELIRISTQVFEKY